MVEGGGCVRVLPAVEVPVDLLSPLVLSYKSTLSLERTASTAVAPGGPVERHSSPMTRRLLADAPLSLRGSLS